MAILRPGPVTLRATRPSHVMMIGGESQGHRHLWWNFVHSSRQRIDQAKQAWLGEEFDPVPNDSEFIPLPEEK